MIALSAGVRIALGVEGLDAARRYAYSGEHLTPVALELGCGLVPQRLAQTVTGAAASIAIPAGPAMKESPTLARVSPKLAVASLVSCFDKGGKLVLGSTPRPKASFRRAALLPVTEVMMPSAAKAPTIKMGYFYRRAGRADRGVCQAHRAGTGLRLGGAPMLQTSKGLKQGRDPPADLKQRPRALSLGLGHCLVNEDLGHAGKRSEAYGLLR
jgi:hypothetical protein